MPLAWWGPQSQSIREQSKETTSLVPPIPVGLCSGKGYVSVCVRVATPHAKPPPFPLVFPSSPTPVIPRPISRRSSLASIHPSIHLVSAGHRQSIRFDRSPSPRLLVPLTSRPDFFLFQVASLCSACDRVDQKEEEDGEEFVQVGAPLRFVSRVSDPLINGVNLLLLLLVLGLRSSG